MSTCVIASYVTQIYQSVVISQELWPTLHRKAHYQQEINLKGRNVDSVKKEGPQW